MALSGSITSQPIYSGVKYRVEWETTQSIPALTSSIKVKVYLVNSKSVYVKDDGVKHTIELLEDDYAVDSRTFTTDNFLYTTARETLLCETTFSSKGHNDDGTAKNWAIRCTINFTEVEIGGLATIIGATKYSDLAPHTITRVLNLPAIQRASTLTVSNGTLGIAQTMAVTRNHSDFSHTITYSCGGASDTICDKSTDDSITWTPPISLASQDTKSTKASVTITIQTIYSGKAVETRTYNVTYNVPSSVKPEVKLTVVDGEGHAEKYGKYIQNVSTFDVTADITPGEGAEITTTTIAANGASYTETQFTTSVVKSSGTQTISASVVDERKRTDTDSVSVDAYAYTFPIVSALKVKRCDSNGTENMQGEFIQVTFSASITNLDNQNSAAYALQYKKSTDESYTTISFDDIAGQYTVEDYTYKFEADTGSAYDIIITATDDFVTTSRNTNGSTALVIMHFKASGRGMGIGKISELDDVVDMGFMARFFGGLLLKEAGNGTDYNTLTTSNIYFCAKANIDSYENCPVDCDHILTVFGNADGSRTIQQIQTIEAVPLIMTRCQTQNGWGSWI